jgi:4-amino-4-deoxy-L-arabinose transferase-like glycosyltransferase
VTALALIAITAVAAGLRLLHLGDVPGNPFYDAAVHTMAQSWHAFVFGGLDPSGGVSVDKPPVDLWVQVLSVKLLGYNATALKLPQALAGTLSVPLLYDVIRRPFGRAAGLAAAATLAVLPVAVLTARSDTMDTFMAFLLLGAAWFVIRAAETGRLRWLLVAGAVVGLAFNVKLFQALLPLPALALLWFVASPLPLRRRLSGALAAAAVALVVGFAWIVPVALTPASERPYPIGSTNGSIWNLVFTFNGTDRLKGRPVTTPDTLPAGSKVSAQVARSQQQRAALLSTTGATRLFTRRFGARIGAELLLALLIALALVVAACVAVERMLRSRGADAVEPRTRLRAGVAAAFIVWLGTGALLFTVMRSFHPRYFETISPALAAVIGIGAGVALGAGRIGRVAAALVLFLCALYFGRTADPRAHLALIAGIAAAIALAATALRGAPRAVLVPVAAAALCAALIVPASASWLVVHTRAFDAERSGAMPPGWPPLINRYLRLHRDGTRYALASIAPAKAAPLIADHPEPVLMLTSYRSRPLLSVGRLARDVANGQVRYFLIGRRCSSALTRNTAACPATARWVIAHSTDVTRAVGLGHTRLVYRINLCSGLRRPQPAAARVSARGRSARRSGRPRSARIASRATPATCVQHQTT